MKLSIVVPTNRPDRINNFLIAWREQFDKYQASLYIVRDGQHPTVNGKSVKQVMGSYSDLIYNFNDGVRNLGFAQAYKDGAEVIISLDDDTEPFGDTIGDHLFALKCTANTDWFNTAEDVRMRGHLLSHRSEVVLSHGTWEGVADFDASTQLIIGTPAVKTKKSLIPKGILFPMCIMNVAFKRKMVPYMYQAPMFGDINRFADIWGGIEAKKDLDARGWAAVTGYAKVKHERASDPFVNLVKEARGIGMNEHYGEDPYFKLFFEKRKRWQEFLKQYD